MGPWARSHCAVLGRSLIAWLALATSVFGMESASLRPAPQPLLADAPRIGVNLGGWSTWGADQLMNNVLKNPGFENTLDRSLVVVREIAGRVVADDAPWLARGDGFWAGGRFEVRTGRAAGASGNILASVRAGKDGPDSFTLDPFPVGLSRGDAIAVSVARAAGGVPLWWVGGGNVATTTADARPGSPGRQALRLIAARGKRSQLNHYLDAIGERAGKLLPVRGTWELSFWARGNGYRDRLEVTFARRGSPAFLRQSIALGHEWKRYAYRFDSDDTGAADILTLAFEIEGGEALLDDVSLGELQAGPGGFRKEVAALLRQLRPGYLRDWQGQLGDTLENRLAAPYARHPVRYRPGEAEQLYLYGLPEFLELCAAVGAQPWVVAPPLMGDAEWRAFGAYLARMAAQYRFREILLEFGNENWNPLFRPGGFVAEAAQAQAADRAFRLVKAGAGGYNGIVTLVNAQFVNAASWGRLAGLSREAARVAVAPYFLYTLERATPQGAAAAAFTDGDDLLRAGIGPAAAHGKGVAVYEVNFHTTGGEADAALRDLAVSGAHSGAALARRLLQSMLAGVREQAVYALAGFDSYTDTRKLTRLWGVARDLAPGQLRPTGLALELLNSAVGGAVRASDCAGTPCDRLTAAWFGQGAQMRLAVVSAAASPILVRTAFPCSQPLSLRVLDGSDPAANNETPGASAVAIAPGHARCTGAWEFVLPPHSLAVFSQKPAGAALSRNPSALQ